MLLQASMNTFKKCFAEVVEILKIVSYEPAYHWIKGQNVRKKEYTAMVNFFSVEKWQTVSTTQTFIETFVFVFYAQYLRFWEQ